MARARITLREGLTFNEGPGRKWVKGKPQVLANASEIERYRNNSRFDVTDLSDEEPKDKAEAKGGGKKKKKSGKKKKGKS